ncbi:MAG: DegT/DnrJ/EryC1/StrS family aminotransferase, partial [Planctomycetes bacterium]|nr:DegT/DnrJ/EryC1/StrS family aminotransferase [Planctomycetota bacterium]
KIITTGDGGVVTTDSPLLYERAVRYHDQGNVRAPHAALLGRLRVKPFAGENYRMAEMSGAMALAQLKKLPQILKKMRAARDKIAAAVKDLEGIKVRPSHDPSGDAGNALVLFFENSGTAGLFIKAINAENISFVRLYGGKPVYMTPQVSGMDVASSVKCPYQCPLYSGTVDYSDGLCPNAEDLAARVAMIGIVPVYTARDVRDIIAGIRKVHSAIVAG